MRSRAVFERAADEEQEVVRVHRLLEEVVRAVLHRLHGLVYRAVGGHEDDGHIGVGRLRGAQHVEARAVRHPQVGEDEAEGLARERLRGGARVLGLGDRVAGALQRQPQHAPQALLVFDEQDVRHKS